MHVTEKVRHFENLHIVFWLIKDSCWMMQLKIPGVIMIVPTIYLAIHLMYKTRRSPDFLINAAILCWITANSYWMIVEFFFHDQFRTLSAFPFALGFIFVGIYFFRYFRARREAGTLSRHDIDPSK
jgi:hypothetical protein